MNVEGRTIEIAGIPHYVARPAAPTGAGVLLLPHLSGIDAFIRSFADGLAERGLTTVAWNPYPSAPIGAPPDIVRPLGAALQDQPTMRALSGCIDTMENDLGLDAVGTIGFCMGGRFALLFAARESRLRAAVASYASVPAQRPPHHDLDPVAATAAIACPVQLLYPGRDIITPRPVFEALQHSLQQRSSPTTILFYPDAEHGFFHHATPANEAAARTARPQIHAFLEAHLSAAG